jgi:sugar (pentulose or hexulose) kinase
MGSTVLEVRVSDGISWILAGASLSVAINRPKAGHAELAPETWWEALVVACKHLNLKDKGISGSGFLGKYSGRPAWNRA